MNKEIRNFLKRIGSKGGKVRASRYSKATLRKWAKKGGRPRKNPTAEGRRVGQTNGESK